MNHQPKKNDPFNPEKFGGVQFRHPVVSRNENPRAARVRFRIKGEADGPIYEGQKVYKPCGSCGKGPKRI